MANPLPKVHLQVKWHTHPQKYICKYIKLAIFSLKNQINSLWIIVNLSNKKIGIFTHLMNLTSISNFQLETAPGYSEGTSRLKWMKQSYKFHNIYIVRFCIEMITQNRTKGGYSLFNARHAEKIVWMDLHKQGTEQGPYSQHFICVVT